MDLQTFIQSGLLETYVLGQTTAEERSLVERMLSQHVEARTELSAIEQAIEQYALAQATPPPAWMKGRILDQLEQMPIAGLLAPTAGSTGTLRLFQIMAAALLIVVAFLWYKNNDTQTQQAEQQTQLAAVQNKLSDCTLHTQNTQEMVNVIRDTDTKIYRLTNGGEGSKGGAIMYKNKGRGVIALDISGVMVAAPHKYLQLWAVINDKPVSLGMVNMQAPAGWQKLDYHEDVQYFAISEENDPNGSPTPTVVVMHS